MCVGLAGLGIHASRVVYGGFAGDEGWGRAPFTGLDLWALCGGTGETERHR